MVQLTQRREGGRRSKVSREQEEKPTLETSRGIIPVIRKGTPLRTSVLPHGRGTASPRRIRSICPYSAYKAISNWDLRPLQESKNQPYSFSRISKQRAKIAARLLPTAFALRIVRCAVSPESSPTSRPPALDGASPCLRRSAIAPPWEIENVAGHNAVEQSSRRRASREIPLFGRRRLLYDSAPRRCERGRFWT